MSRIIITYFPTRLSMERATTLMRFPPAGRIGGFPPQLGTARQWHWMSAAASLVILLLFAVTGITLNHAERIGTEPRITTLEIQVPQLYMDTLASADGGALPAGFREWFADQQGIQLPDKAAEWSDWDVTLPLDRPGTDAWLSIDLETGELVYERVNRGWVAFFNDLHTGHQTGVLWTLLTDLFAATVVVFTVTGLLLLYRQRQQRPSTWPLVGLGVLLPILALLFSMHPGT